MKNLSKLAGLLALATGSFLSARAGGYDITIDTASLIGHPASPFSLDFQLNDGSGTGSGLNSALITGFNFGSGAATGSASLIGGASGSLSSSVSFLTTSAFNELYQSFTPGSLLTFHVAFSDALQSGGTPDSFSIAILDKTLGNISTTGVADTLFQIDITGPDALVNLGEGIDPSGVTIVATAVPEPGTTAAVAVATLGAFALWRRFKMAGNS